MSKITIDDGPRLVPVKPMAGKYVGRWSGYNVRFTDRAARDYELCVHEGVRGMNFPVTVIVKEDGEVTVTDI